MSNEKPERCPNCHSVGCLVEYPVLVGRDRVPGTAIRCTVCNTGVVVIRDERDQQI